MVMPTFSSDEKILIKRLKAQGKYDHVVYDLTYLSASVGFLIIGYFAEAAIVGFITGTMIILCFKFYEWGAHCRVIPMWMAILNKYEQACGDQVPNSMTTPPVPRFQFSIRAIFFVLLLICVYCAGWTTGALFRHVTTPNAEDLRHF